jgi:hypothetical protein
MVGQYTLTELMEEPPKVILDLLNGEVVLATILAILFQKSNALQPIKIRIIPNCSYELVQEDVGGCLLSALRNGPMCSRQATGTTRDHEAAPHGLQIGNLNQTIRLHKRR